MDFALYPLIKLVFLLACVGCIYYASYIIYKSKPKKPWLAVLPWLLLPLLGMGLFRISSPQQAEAITSSYDTVPVRAEPVIIKQQIIRYKADDNQEAINRLLKDNEQ